MDDGFYTECATAFQDAFLDAMRNRAFEDPLLSKMLHVTYDHGVSVVAHAGDSVDKSEFTATTTNLPLPVEMLESGDVAQFVRNLEEVPNRCTNR